MHETSPNPRILWRTRTREFDLTRRGAIMGILNVTPDSFSDGGRWVDVESALAHGAAMIAEGAEIIDVGGESTRPGADSVAADEELRRVLPVVSRLAELPGHGENFIISIDTMKPSVARAAVEAGASVINDVRGFRDEGMLRAAKDTGAGLVVMHMRGEPRTMQQNPAYSDVCGEIREFFCQQLERCVASGVPASHIAFDPGIGFGKTPENNLALLRGISGLAGAGHAIAVGVSRKSFIGKTLGSAAIADRSWPTVALTSHSRERGARIFRVHEVRHNLEALRMTEAILGA